MVLKSPPAYREIGAGMQAAVREELDLLAIKLRRAETDYERARSRGDAERVWRSQLQMDAITSERDRLIRQLGAQMSGKLQ